MKVQHYKWLMAAQTSRRAVLKGAASAGALALASGGALGALTRAASAQDNLRAEILKIPGVGKGSPTDADWQKVGEMCLGATKANVAEGEFAGVELTFMGLNNQNLHNLLFRGFLKSWETYTGAKINWIDLAQADYNARLQQSIATGTVDFDIIEMGAPFEGDTAGKGLLDEMPDWVKTQIDADDLVGYLKPPVGTWDGKTYRITIDGDCHTFAYRKDYSDGRRDQRGDRHDRGAHHLGSGQRVLEEGRRPDRSPDRAGGLRLSRSAQIPVGRLRLLLPRGPRGGLRQASRRSGLAVRPRHDEANGQQSGLGAGDPGRDGPRRDRRRLSGRPGQHRPQRHRLPAVPGRNRRHADAGGATSAHRPAPPTAPLSATSSVSRSIPAPPRSTTPSPAHGRSRRAASTSLRTWPISAGAST